MNFETIGDELLDTVGNVIDFAGDAAQNAGNQGAAVVAVNLAQANAITEKAKRQTETQKMIMKVIVLVILVVGVISLFSIASRKK